MIAHHGQSSPLRTQKNSRTQKRYRAPSFEQKETAQLSIQLFPSSTGWPPPSTSPLPPAALQLLREVKWGGHSSKDLVQRFGVLIPTSSFSPLHHQLDEGPLQCQETFHQDIAADASGQTYGKRQRIEVPGGGLEKPCRNNWLPFSPVEQAKN